MVMALPLTAASSVAFVCASSTASGSAASYLKAAKRHDIDIYNVDETSMAGLCHGFSASAFASLITGPLHALVWR